MALCDACHLITIDCMLPGADVYRTTGPRQEYGEHQVGSGAG